MIHKRGRFQYLFALALDAKWMPFQECFPRFAPSASITPARGGSAAAFVLTFFMPLVLLALSAIGEL
jgi:hypothetical protein